MYRHSLDKAQLNPHLDPLIRGIALAHGPFLQPFPGSSFPFNQGEDAPQTPDVPDVAPCPAELGLWPLLNRHLSPNPVPLGLRLLSLLTQLAVQSHSWMPGTQRPSLSKPRNPQHIPFLLPGSLSAPLLSLHGQFVAELADFGSVQRPGLAVSFKNTAFKANTPQRVFLCICNYFIIYRHI